MEIMQGLSVAYRQSFEAHAHRLFANEEAAWEVGYAEAVWDGSSNVCESMALKNNVNLHAHTYAAG